MSLASTIERFVRTNVPPWTARLGKRLIVRPRYRATLRVCRDGYRMYGSKYPNPVLFVAGLPKSGTSWLERMLASFPGYHDVIIPESIDYERTHGGSHDYDLPRDMFSRFKGMLVISKMHVHGSKHNADVLREAGVPYVVMFRDLRDVAVSYVFYVRRTPWHPEHPQYRKRSPAEGLQRFGDTLLPRYVQWVRSWHANRDPGKSIELRYEQLLADPKARMTEVAQHFGLTLEPAELDRIIEANSFAKQSAGRDSERNSNQSFFRKGVAGDWANHLTGELKDNYKRTLGTFLIEFGYEKDESW